MVCRRIHVISRLVYATCRKHSAYVTVNHDLNSIGGFRVHFHIVNAAMSAKLSAVAAATSNRSTFYKTCQR